MLSYKYSRNSFDNLDILCCRHKKFPYSWIGHTTQVYKDLQTGQLSVFESTSLNKFSGKNGVQLNPMGKWLYEYNGKVGVRRLEFLIKDDIYARHPPQDVREKFADYIERYRGTSYPDLTTKKGRWFLINAALDLHIWPFSIWSENKLSDDIIFCSHNVAKSMQFCGIQDMGKVPPEYTPDDFENGTIESLHLIGCKISKIDWIK